MAAARDPPRVHRRDQGAQGQAGRPGLRPEPRRHAARSCVRWSAVSATSSTTSKERGSCSPIPGQRSQGRADRVVLRGGGSHDWAHPETGAKVLKAQHPEFEMWSQGIHARSGVACADCHMPYPREGAIKVSDHHVRSPLLNVAAPARRANRFPRGAQEPASTPSRLATRADSAGSRGRRRPDGRGRRRQKGHSRERGSPSALTSTASAVAARLHLRGEFAGLPRFARTARILAEAIDYARQGQLAADGAARRQRAKLAQATRSPR